MQSSCEIFSNGFDTHFYNTRLSHAINYHGPLRTEALPKILRLFLISHVNNEVKETKNVETEGQSIEQTKNRKKVSFCSEYEFMGIDCTVNAKGAGIYHEILSSMLNQLEIACLNWRRVFVYRFDFHLEQFSSDNFCMTQFRKNLVQKLKRLYGFKQVGYCWVREQEKENKQHYHWVLFMDGDLIRHSSRLSRIILDTAKSISEFNHIPVIKNPFYLIDNLKRIEDVVYRISYLAKVRGKGFRPPQTNDFACSRLKSNAVLKH